MRKHPRVFIRTGSFIAALGDEWQLQPRLVRSAGVALLGGQGLFLNELTAGNGGWAFIAAGGTVIEKDLQEGETILVDSMSLVAFEPSVKFDIRLVRTCLTCCVGGMGLANAVLTGPGTVFIDTMSKHKFLRNFPVGARGGPASRSGFGDDGNGGGHHRHGRSGA